MIHWQGNDSLKYLLCISGTVLLLVQVFILSLFINLWSTSGVALLKKADMILHMVHQHFYNSLCFAASSTCEYSTCLCLSSHLCTLCLLPKYLTDALSKHQCHENTKLCHHKTSPLDLLRLYLSSSYWTPSFPRQLHGKLTHILSGSANIWMQSDS